MAANLDVDDVARRSSKSWITIGDGDDALQFVARPQTDQFVQEEIRIGAASIDEFGLIVAGWSGEWDHALRGAFLRAPSRRYPTYWLARGGLSERGQELVTQRRASVVSGTDADTFFDALKLKLETIQQSRQPNPASVELMIAMAKRFMDRPEHRIQLDDLITAQTRQTIADFAPHFAGGSEVRNQAFTDWVPEYEAIVEPIGRLASVLGRWGTGDELSLVMDAVKGLYAEAHKEQAGYTHWLALKNYPAALVVLGYALGLTRANRLDVLYRLLSSTVMNRRELPGLVGYELSPFYLESGNGLLAHWKTLGSSRITGKDALDLHEKEFAIPVTVRHPLDDLYSIVYSFQLTGVHRPANPTHDAPPVTF